MDDFTKRHLAAWCEREKEGPDVAERLERFVDEHFDGDPGFRSWSEIRELIRREDATLEWRRERAEFEAWAGRQKRTGGGWCPSCGRSHTGTWRGKVTCPFCRWCGSD